MQNRREFLRFSAATGAAIVAGCRHSTSDHLKGGVGGALHEFPAEAASDEAFWREVRRSFDLEPSVINLNHGLSPAPREVQEALAAELNRVNRAPLFHMRDAPEEGRREEARLAAARALGCSPEEMAITRSGTDSLQIAQLGIDLKPGDEVLSTREDYWSGWATWQQRVSREGSIYKEIDLGGPYPPNDEIVARFEEAFTPRTRVVLFCQVTWRTGHILPVREICAAARSRGIQSIVDGAQGFAHVPFSLADLGCDYYATSGHKWLSAPLGTGLLYVRRERIHDLWPPSPSHNDGSARDNIRKFESIGSRPPAFHNAIIGSVRFLENLGVKRKAERLHHLKRLWADRLARHDRVHIVTDLAANRSGGLASFYVDGIESAELAQHLLDRHRILVGPPSTNSWSGPPLVRVVPNVFTSAEEIDAFAGAVEEVLKRGRATGE